MIPDREIAREHLLDVDALVVRSKTKVTGDLLSGTPVQFAGTATAGTDHMDLAWLEAESRSQVVSYTFARFGWGGRVLLLQWDADCGSFPKEAWWR